MPPMTVVPPELFDVASASDCDAPSAKATPPAAPAGGGGRGGNGEVGRVGDGMIMILISRGGLSLLLLIVKPLGEK